MEELSPQTSLTVQMVVLISKKELFLQLVPAIFELLKTIKLFKALFNPAKQSREYLPNHRYRSSISQAQLGFSTVHHNMGNTTRRFRHVSYTKQIHRMEPLFSSNIFFSS